MTMASRVASRRLEFQVLEGHPQGLGSGVQGPSGGPCERSSFFHFHSLRHAGERVGYIRVEATSYGCLVTKQWKRRDKADWMGGCPVPDGRRKPALVEPPPCPPSPFVATLQQVARPTKYRMSIALRARPRQPCCAQDPVEPVFPLEAVTIGFPEERGMHCFP